MSRSFHLRIPAKIRQGQDGKTSYERWKGRKFVRDVVEFGERVSYLVQGTLGKDKGDCRWEDGIFVGSRKKRET